MYRNKYTLLEMDYDDDEDEDEAKDGKEEDGDAGGSSGAVSTRDLAAVVRVLCGSNGLLVLCGFGVCVLWKQGEQGLLRALVFRIARWTHA